jgi:hypothetical protein
VIDALAEAELPELTPARSVSEGTSPNICRYC